MRDPTAKRLFFQLVENARRLKRFNWTPSERQKYLLGMLNVIKRNRKDFTIADSMRDTWKQGGVFE